MYSFENTPSHLHTAVRNYEQWRANWALAHMASPWPDNVRFIEADASAVGEHVTGSVDAVSSELEGFREYAVSPYITVHGREL